MMVSGVRISSAGYTEFKPRRRGPEEGIKDGSEINGPNELVLWGLLSKAGVMIRKSEAKDILGEEMFLSDFVKKHSESLLLWEDEEKIGTVRE